MLPQTRKHIGHFGIPLQPGPVRINQGCDTNGDGNETDDRRALDGSTRYGMAAARAAGGSSDSRRAGRQTGAGRMGALRRRPAPFARDIDVVDGMDDGDRSHHKGAVVVAESANRGCGRSLFAFGPVLQLAETDAERRSRRSRPGLGLRPQIDRRHRCEPQQSQDKSEQAGDVGHGSCSLKPSHPCIATALENQECVETSPSIRAGSKALSSLPGLRAGGATLRPPGTVRSGRRLRLRG